MTDAVVWVSAGRGMQSFWRSLGNTFNCVLFNFDEGNGKLHPLIVHANACSLIRDELVLQKSVNGDCKIIRVFTNNFILPTTLNVKLAVVRQPLALVPKQVIV